MEDIEYIIAESKEDYWIKLPRGKQYIHVLPEIVYVRDLNLDNEIVKEFKNAL